MFAALFAFISNGVTTDLTLPKKELQSVAVVYFSQTTNSMKNYLYL